MYTTTKINKFGEKKKNAYLCDRKSSGFFALKAIFAIHFLKFADYCLSSWTLLHVRLITELQGLRQFHLSAHSNYY